MLNSNVAQQILMEVDETMRSFFELIKLVKSGKYNYKDINGSLNILRKSGIIDISHIQKYPNILKQPLRIKIA